MKKYTLAISSLVGLATCAIHAVETPSSTYAYLKSGVGLQVNSVSQFSPSYLPQSWNELFQGATITSLVVETATPDIVITPQSATDFTVQITKRGSYLTKLAIGLDRFPGQIARIPLRLVGYEVDRTKPYAPDVKPITEMVNNESPLFTLASITMTPYVANVHWDFTMFAHRSVFKDGARYFDITTGMPTTSLGEPGWKVSYDPVAASKVGTLSFDLTIPGGEKSFCVSTKQQPVLPEAPLWLSPIFAPTANN